MSARQGERDAFGRPKPNPTSTPNKRRFFLAPPAGKRKAKRSLEGQARAKPDSYVARATVLPSRAQKKSGRAG